MAPKQLTADQLRFLSTLQVGLVGLERDLELAQIIGYYDKPEDLHHPTLAFAFRHAPVAVITVTVLHLAEALDPYLERAAQVVLGRSLRTGSGRDWRFTDPDFQRVKELRDARVAHYFKLRPRGEAAVRDARESNGTVIACLLGALAKVRSLFDDLVAGGLFKGVGRPPVTLRLALRFTKDDVGRLIQAANALKSSA